MITKLEQFKESRLLPKNLDGRLEKLIKQNLKLLQQEVIEGDIRLDDLWDFSPDQVKIKTINGTITIKVSTGKIPKWLENVTVNGYFYCSFNKLISLDGCPNTVNRNFNCAYNKLTSLEGCPKIVNGFFDCSNNRLVSLKSCPKIVNGDLYCSNNPIKFTLNNVPKDTKIKGEIWF